jgi:hypothetical protein
MAAMNDAFLQDFTDEQIKQQLFRAANVARLKAIVEQDQRRLEQLAALADVHKKGDKVNESDVMGLFSTARNEVDGILAVSGLPLPALKGERLFSRKYAHIAAAFGGGFACLAGSAALLAWPVRRKAGPNGASRSRGRISRRRWLAALAMTLPGGLLVAGAGVSEERRLNDAGYIWDQQLIEFPLGRSRVQTELLLVHEYVHHIQRLVGLYSETGLVLAEAIEGHARGVERLWAQQRTQSGQGSAYEYDQLLLRLPELKRTYMALCDRFGAPGESPVGNAPAANKRAGELDSFFYSYALFRIWEQGMGPGVYRDLVHGTLTVPAL